MPRYKLIVEYDGTGYLGWQKQKDGPSIQQELEEAVEKFCGEEVGVSGSGRTDAGVHARGQVVHFDLNEKHDPYSVFGGINYHLNNNRISVLSCEEVSDEFHSRFDAVQRTYRYIIINRRAPLTLDHPRAWHVKEPLNIEKMQEAGNALMGTHDFSSLRASICQAKTPVKTIDAITVSREGERVIIEIKARSFLHHMVRNIAGTLRYVGRGKWDIQNVIDMLEAKDRSKAPPTAPAKGLYFMKVSFDE